MTVERLKRLSAPGAALMVCLGLSLSGCNTSGTSTPAPAAASKGAADGGFLSNLFSKPAAEAAPAEPAAAQKTAAVGDAPTALQRCPEVEISPGAQTIAVHAGEPIPANLRYQVTLADFARECSRAGMTGSVKLGVSGRVILGPKGVAGAYVAPLRIFIKRGGVDQVLTTVVKTNVKIAAGETSAAFTYVAEDLSFPLEADDKLTRYLISVGFEGKTPPKS